MPRRFQVELSGGSDRQFSAATCSRSKQSGLNRSNAQGAHSSSKRAKGGMQNGRAL
jgi:hypothetical protein